MKIKATVKIKTEDLIRSLRACNGRSVCEDCAFADEDFGCCSMLLEEAANRLEELQKVILDHET